MTTDESSEQPRKGLGRRLISPPATAAEVSESDLDAAIRQFNEDVPKQYKGLLESTSEPESDEPERI